jgi:hypothetical protein
MQPRNVAVGFQAAPFHGVPYRVIVLREELPHRDVRRSERSAGFLAVHYGLHQLVGGLLAGAPVDAAPLPAYPVPRFPPSIRPLARAATLAVAVLPRHKPPPVIRGSVRLGSTVGVKTLPKARNPLFHGSLEAKDIALSRRKPGFESRWGHSPGRHTGRPDATYTPKLSTRRRSLGSALGSNHRAGGGPGQT